MRSRPTCSSALKTSTPARGPLVTLHRALKDGAAGEVFELLATDPGSKSDVPSWATLSGNELLETSHEDGVFRYLIRKA